MPARERWPSLLVAFASGSVLTSLVWLLDRDRASERATVQAATAHVASDASDDSRAPDCPAPPSCPPVASELDRDDVELSLEPPQGSAASAAKAAEIQAMVSEAMSSVSVSASFDLDCAARPCLAVSWVLGLADEQPTREEEALVEVRIDDLLVP